MVVLAKGQLSFLILSCLAEKDMYGLELIEEIKKRSGFEIKLPSLYSNLNRMKELKYISSYLKESTKGPKCAYSSITEAGRKELERLSAIFGSFSVAVKNDFVENPQDETINLQDSAEISSLKRETEVFKNTFEDYDDYFADIPEESSYKEKICSTLEKSDENSQPTDAFNGNLKEDVTEFEVNENILKEEKDDEISSGKEISDTENNSENTIEECKQNASTYILQEKLLMSNDNEKTQEPEEELPKNDAVFLTEDERVIIDNHNDYNKKLYDVSKEYIKNKKRRSFSENQMEMTVESALPLEEKNERKLENINNLKEALLQTKQGNYEKVSLDFKEKYADKNFIKENSPVDEINRHTNNEIDIKSEEKIKDDGVFITDRVVDIPKTKRFDPPRLNELLSTYQVNLPAPKRNVSLDPNCSDVKEKIKNLYLKTASESEGKSYREQKRNSDIENFEDLKSYYEAQNISFKTYSRTEKKINHNTNKLIFFVDLIVFALVSIGSATMFLIFNSVNLINANTNFLFYLFPALYLLYLGTRLYMYKKVKSKVPKPLFNFIVIWGSAVLLSGIVFCLNLAFGMPINQISQYLPSILVPIFMIIMIIVVRHYIMLFALKKYWK